MSPLVTFFVHSVAIGLGATAFMDAATIVRTRVLRESAFDYALLGRWVGHLAKGRFRHERIGAAAPVAGERVLGWTAHYAIGVGFAALLLAACGLEWLRDPEPTPALLVGLATVVAPFFVLQPALGLGIAASRTSSPARARVRSLVTHLSFGLGLYVAAELWRFAIRAVG